LRVVDATSDSITCDSNEVLVSALCKGGPTAAISDGTTARCPGAPGITGLCMRK
jgi:hypothetical protein